ncbi:MAG: stage III sporulation protein AA [Eubacteriales bacterium]|nr:stage III sporulation protein AA [Eubacteriales bacterium]
MYTNAGSQWLQGVRQYLPVTMKRALQQVSDQILCAATELRFGTERAAEILCGNRRIALTAQTPPDAPQPLRLTPQDCCYFFNMITAYSPYAYAGMLQDGFITLPNGCRVGIAGVRLNQGAMDAQACRGSSFSVRIARDVPGAAQCAFPALMAGGQLHNALVISPPGYGKTTFLRDAARRLDSQYGLRVCIIDERMEIAGFYDQRAQFDLGSHTDVVSGCPKTEGMMKAVRALNPQVIITDEIGSAADAQALREVSRCGVGILASAHGMSWKDILRRPNIAGIVDDGIFEMYFVLPPPWDMVKSVRSGLAVGAQERAGIA